ncbi:DUF5004 domain-containing protein [Thalassotalea sediminis]|uniref:DUF5004 domain-containing protein n=1 Tax=Thalassotalea sediminis TaxID=1759089 RepID=UPI002573B153|nr:hypothetical protein [Thalassotalea sediminis]
MKFISIILIFIFLNGCSTTKVYLYKRYLSDEDVLLITQKLEALDYKVENNTLAFPDEIQKSTILYSPFVEGKDNLDDFISVINQLGWPDVDVQPLFKGNHWYSKNSIGLFLITEGMEQNDKVLSQDLVNQYMSDKCDLSAKLILNQDNTYQISYENDPNNKTEHKSGKWELTGYPYIQLTSSNGYWTFYFEIHKNIITDLIGKVELLELKPLSSHSVYPHCSFVYGVRT